MDLQKRSFAGVFQNKFHKIHWKTPVLESLFNKVAGLKAYNFIKRDSDQVFSSKYCEIVNSFLYRAPLIITNYKTCFKQMWRKSFLGRIFLRNLLEIISSLCCSVSKNNFFAGFSQFLSFFKHVRGVSRTQSNIKMEPIAKIVNGSRRVFRIKWNI